MPLAKYKDSSVTTRKMRPALSPEARENQMIALAMDAAEKQMRDGTATSQVITHFLKLGSTLAKLEHERRLTELELMTAKTEQLKSTKRTEELMEEAIRAFKRYNGQGDQDEY